MYAFPSVICCVVYCFLYSEVVSGEWQLVGLGSIPVHFDSIPSVIAQFPVQFHITTSQSYTISVHTLHHIIYNYKIHITPK